MKIRKKLITSLNIISLILFVIPAFKLDLFKENYSTLSLTTRGYLYVLFLGLFIGTILGYETSIVSNKKRGILMFLFMLIGVLIPHHVPYNLQGNLHLVCAYFGFAGISIITILNTRNLKTWNVFIICLFLAFVFYLKFGMVNTISEIIVMISYLFTNYIGYKKMVN